MADLADLNGTDIIPTADDAMASTEVDLSVLAEDQDNGIMLDPASSARQYTLDPGTNVQREVWRPGDGDGDRVSDYYDKPAPLAPVEKRRRFYQSPTGTGPIKAGTNEPPKYVILDDLTVHEILASDLPKSTLGKYWGHDFASMGKVRANRPHRGRAAIGDHDAEGDNKYHFSRVGADSQTYYYFYGQPNYVPIIYQSGKKESAVLSQPAKTNAPSTLSDLLESKKRGHNQHTPKDQLVKYGAPSNAKNANRYRPRISSLLPYHRRPTEMLNKSKMSDEGLQKSIAEDGSQEEAGSDDVGHLWTDPDTSIPRKKQRLDTQYEQEDSSLFDTDTSFDLGSGLSPYSDGPVNTQNATSDVYSANLEQHPVSQPQDFFSRLLREKEASESSSISNGEHTFLTDSGSYATKLENELAEAKKIIEDQKTKIAELEMARQKADDGIAELEGGAMTFREDLEGTKTDEGHAEVAVG